MPVEPLSWPDRAVARFRLLAEGPCLGVKVDWQLQHGIAARGINDASQKHAGGKQGKELLQLGVVEQVGWERVLEIGSQERMVQLVPTVCQGAGCA